MGWKQPRWWLALAQGLCWAKTVTLSSKPNAATPWGEFFGTPHLSRIQVSPKRLPNAGGERVLRAPADGVLVTHAKIGEQLEIGQLHAEIDSRQVIAPFQGILHGLLHDGLPVRKGIEIGDLDPCNDPRYCTRISDKSLAIGDGVLEVILSQTELRPYLWNLESDDAGRNRVFPPGKRGQIGETR